MFRVVVDCCTVVRMNGVMLTVHYGLLRSTNNTMAPLKTFTLPPQEEK